MITYTIVESYINAQENGKRIILTVLRDLVREVCPLADESVAYGMPAYKYHGKPLIYFTVFAHHIGIYATPSTNIAFTKELSSYKKGKGSIQIPLDQELPVDLIKQIIIFKMKEIDSLV